MRIEDCYRVDGKSAPTGDHHFVKSKYGSSASLSLTFLGPLNVLLIQAGAVSLIGTPESPRSDVDHLCLFISELSALALQAVDAVNSIKSEFGLTVSMASHIFDGDIKESEPPAPAVTAQSSSSDTTRRHTAWSPRTTSTSPSSLSASYQPYYTLPLSP